MQTKLNNPVLKAIMLVIGHSLRVVLASVFVFSGFVKAIDPLGSSYKIQDYLESFGPFFGMFNSLALVFAILLSSLELVLGLMLLFQVKIRFASAFTVFYMVLMTLLTLYVALENPVTDCGCFGDAIVLTNWQTFFKNIFLLLVSLILYWNRKDFIVLYKNYFAYILISGFAILSVLISVYNLRHLPWIDFRPYKIGTNIQEKLEADSVKEEYVTTFLYEKNGEIKEFTLENYPENDTTWKFVEQKTEVIRTGKESELHDFVLIDEGYNDMTTEILDYAHSTVLLVMYDLEKTNRKGVEKAKEQFAKSKLPTTKFYILTASGTDAIERFKKETNIEYPFLMVDPITLKTMIRANPGVVVLKKGVVVAMYNWRDFDKINIK